MSSPPKRMRAVTPLPPLSPLPPPPPTPLVRACAPCDAAAAATAADAHELPRAQLLRPRKRTPCRLRLRRRRALLRPRRLDFSACAHEPHEPHEPHEAREARGEHANAESEHDIEQLRRVVMGAARQRFLQRWNFDIVSGAQSGKFEWTPL